MKNLLDSTRKIATSLACLALLIFASSASAALTITAENQTGPVGPGPWTPTWVINTNTSLIAGVIPSATSGNFSLETQNGTRDVNTLTVNTDLTLFNFNNQTSGTTNYVTVGNGAGNLIVYTLPAGPANGYNLTNISFYGGWANNGRDALAFTVLYSTIADPASFKVLTAVQYNPAVAANTPTANRAIIADSTGGVIAANVAAVKFIFNVPTVENGFAGCAAILVGGQAAGGVVSPVLSITTSNQNDVANPFTPSWTLETPSLISATAPSTANGNFTLEGSAGTSILTDGVIGNSGDLAGFATCGGGGGSGNTLIYTLTNVVNGTDVTNIVVYSGWGDNGRHGQYYILSYSTVAAPTTYIPITTVYYLPALAGGLRSANRVAINMTDGSPLASAVANIKFDFSGPPSSGSFNNGYQGYSEIIVQGKDTTAPPPPPSPFLVQDTLPVRAETFVGDQVVLTAVYSNAPPATVQWQYINAGGTVTNDIPGATTETLTLNNVQLADSGSYRLKAVNATNGAAAPSYSTPAPLAVSAPATVGNVIAKNTGQVGPYPFYPAWTIDTNSDLIFGFGNSGAGPGNFAVEAGLAGDPAILTDGALSNDKALMVSCGWVNVGAGQSMTYTLPAGPSFGYEITNITVYGGWPDDGRNQQKYQILYSTFSAPSTFVSIGTFDYNPSFNDGAPNSTRVILVPLTGVLAHNVAAVQVNFNMQSKNNWNGYSEITLGGTPALGVFPAVTQDITPLTAEDVVGSSLTMTAAISDATSYQWQKNGTNLIGQTSPTLTLNNLQLEDTATNGGYRLLGINAAGTNATRGCMVVVNPAPAATNNIVKAFAIQTSDASALNPFSSTWDTTQLGASLIAGQNPPSEGFGPGNFNDPDVNFPGSAGGLPILTDGNYGTFAYDGSHPAFAAAGPNAGEYVTYALGANANGYSITNIQIAGGWNDNGRNSQYYTILYSTVANTNVFLPLTTVARNLVGYGANNSTTIRTTLTPATGVLASNVYAVQVDFQFPEGVPNGYSGYSEISIFGSPSATPPPAGPVIAVEHEETSNIWTVETPNLIANQLPSSQGPGTFTQEGGNVTNLTDGQIGFGFAFAASCGAEGGSVPWIIFNSATGWDLTNIVVYTLWNDYGRDGQFYNVSYSTLSAPTTFLPLASVAYNPFVPHNGTATGNRVNIAPPLSQTVLANNVAAVKFDFTLQGSQDFGWSGYSEIVLQGSSLAPATPPVVNSPTVSGGNLILTGTGGTPNYGYSVVTSTNLMTPTAEWTVSATGVLNGSGAFSNAIPINVSQPATFFRLRML